MRRSCYRRFARNLSPVAPIRDRPRAPTSRPTSPRISSSSAATSKPASRAADYVVEREFRTATVHQGYIEPHNAVALYSSDGHATIYCSTQGTFNVRTLTATVLKMTEGEIKVVPAEIGGGFGGKTTIYLEPLAAAARAKRAGGRSR